MMMMVFYFLAIDYTTQLAKVVKITSPFFLYTFDTFVHFADHISEVLNTCSYFHSE